jgi:hypothetical protein
MSLATCHSERAERVEESALRPYAKTDPSLFLPAFDHAGSLTGCAQFDETRALSHTGLTRNRKDTKTQRIPLWIAPGLWKTGTDESSVRTTKPVESVFSGSHPAAGTSRSSRLRVRPPSGLRPGNPPGGLSRRDRIRDDGPRIPKDSPMMPRDDEARHRVPPAPTGSTLPQFHSTASHESPAG